MPLKIENSRRVAKSRPVCMDLKGPDTPDAIRQSRRAVESRPVCLDKANSDGLNFELS
jgi:hypothetical protein